MSLSFRAVLCGAVAGGWMLAAAVTGVGADPSAAPVAPGDVVLVDFSAT